METFLLKFVTTAWQLTCEMSPYLLLGFLIAGILSVLISAETVEKHIGKRGIGSVMKASLFGVPLPLCSCGVVPVAMSLRKHGASRGAVTSFLISTPLTGMDSILVSYSLLGPLFAIIRPITAFITGVAGGMVVNATSGPRIPEGNNGEVARLVCSDECCVPVNGRSKPVRMIRYALITLPRDIGKFLIIGLFIAALISALVPANFLSSYMGRGLVPMLVMLVAAVPLYVCSTASVPVAASFIAAGVSPGAALVFLMSGPATNAATVTTMWAKLGRRTTLIYLGAVAVGAVLSGFVLDALVYGVAARLDKPAGWELPAWFTIACSVALLALILPSFFVRKPKGGHGECADPDCSPFRMRNVCGTDSHGESCSCD